jgi:hypothetical protein
VLEPRDVPADARWMAHVDVEALSRSKLLAALRERGDDLLREFDVDDLERAFGFDFERDVRSLTQYGRAAGEADVVSVVRARASIDRAWPALVERCGAPVRVLGRDAYRTPAGANALHFARVSEPGSAAPVFLVATSETALRDALTLRSGQAANLTTPAADSLIARPSSRSIYFASGSVAVRRSPFTAASLELLSELAALERADRDSLVRLARTLTFDVAEDGAQLVARLDLDAADAAGATELSKLFEAPLTRLSRSVAESAAAPYIARITRALTLHANRSRFTAIFRTDIAALLADLTEAERAMGIRSR